MNHLIKIIILIIMTVGLSHCGKPNKKEKRERGPKNTLEKRGRVSNEGQEKANNKERTTLKTTTGSFILVNNTGDDEDVRFSFDGSTEEGLLIEPDKCLEFNSADLPFLTVWAGTGLFESGSIKVLCGGEAPCAIGNYEVTDTAWTFFDSYSMRELEELDEDLKCTPVSS